MTTQQTARLMIIRFKNEDIFTNIKHVLIDLKETVGKLDQE